MKFLAARGPQQYVMEQAMSTDDEDGGPTFPDVAILFENSGLADDEVVDCKVYNKLTCNNKREMWVEMLVCFFFFFFVFLFPFFIRDLSPHHYSHL